MMKKVIGADTKSFLAVILILTIVAVLLMVYKPAPLGAFIAEGLTWEKKAEVIATSEQPTITQHIIFGNSRPANCTDGVYVESGGHAVDFTTMNGIYKDGKCAEADVVIGNVIYQVSENPSAEKAPLSITGSPVANTATYAIYYGKTSVNIQAMPPCWQRCTSDGCLFQDGCGWLSESSQCLNIAAPSCNAIASFDECVGERVGSPAPQAGCGWMGTCVACPVVGDPGMCGEVSGCMWDSVLGCVGRNYCGGGMCSPECSSCFSGPGIPYCCSVVTQCMGCPECGGGPVACESSEAPACGGTCPDGLSCSSGFVPSGLGVSSACQCVEGPPTCTDNDFDSYNVEGGVCGPIDCDDTNPAVNPGAAEIGFCSDGLDNDCNSFIDCADPACLEDPACAPPLTCTDADGDGYNVTGGLLALGPDCGPVDCDDTNPLVNPGAAEVCNNSIDDNCNKKIDCADAACLAAPECQTPTYVNFSGTTTNFDAVPDITNVPECTLENPSYGQVIWGGNVNAGGANFDATVNIGPGFVSINSATLHSSFNSSAQIRLYGVSCPVTTIMAKDGFYSSSADIISGGHDCVASGECSIVDCTAGTLTFTVTHFSGYAPVPPGIVGACASLTAPGYYYLTGPLTDGGPFVGDGKPCISIESNNVIFDCQGNGIISGPPVMPPFIPDNGIEFNASNVTIQNCTVMSFNNAIYCNAGSAFNINNNVLQGNNPGNGIMLSFCSAGNINSNQIKNNFANGINATNSVGITVFNNDINNNGADGIHAQLSSFFNISKNLIWSNEGGLGIHFVSTINSTIGLVNQIYWNGLGGIYFWDSSYNNISDNNITLNANPGINMTAVSNANKVWNNYIRNNRFFGASIDATSSLNTFWNNYFAANAGPNALDLNTNNFFSIAKSPGPNIIGGKNISGNFWDVFSGVDTDGDGISNTNIPFPISGPFPPSLDNGPLTNSGTNVTSCTNLTVNATTYNLTATLAGVQTGRDMCIDVQASDVTFDCGNNAMIGNWGDTYGILVHDSNNSVIRNCNISNYGRGVYYHNSSNNTLADSTLLNNTVWDVDTGYSSINRVSNVAFNNTVASLVESGGIAARYSNGSNYTNPSSYVNISHYLNITDAGGELNKDFTTSSVLDEFYFGQQTSDGGFVMCGQTGVNFGSTKTDAWVIKTDVLGKQIWNYTYAGSNQDRCAHINQTSDGGYIITGFSNTSTGTKIDTLLIKLSSSGGQEWLKTIAYNGASGEDDWGNWVEPTSDGGYIVAGFSGSTILNLTLIKTNSTGDVTWKKRFQAYSIGRSVQQTSDGGYIISGENNYNPTNNAYVWLIKTNSTGDTQWTKTFGSASLQPHFGYCAKQTSDSGYVITGGTSTASSANDVWLIKTNSTGDPQWNKTFGTNTTAGWDVGYTVQQTSDSGYFIAGAKTRGDGYSDGWMIKTNSTGDLIWDRVVVGPYTFLAGQPVSDGTYVGFGGTILATKNPPSSWVALNISYSPADELKVVENSLFLARNNGTWETNTSKFANNFGVDTANNIIYANITGFGSVFAPLGNGVIPTNVTNCTNLTSNATYTLTANLTGVQSGTDYCILFQSDNATLNCNGNKLTGNGSGKGIAVGGKNNVVIQNCEILNYTTGVDDLSPSNNATLVSNNIHDIEHGTNFNGLTNSTITQNTIHDINANNGEFMEFAGGGGSYNNITTNVLYNNMYVLGKGISIDDGHNYYIFNNTIYNISGMTLSFGSIELENTANITVKGNYINDSQGAGIGLRWSNYSLIINNTVTGISEGIRLKASNYTNVTGNWMMNSGFFFTDGSQNNTIYNNYVSETNSVDNCNGCNYYNITKTLGINIIGGSYLGGNYWIGYFGIDTDGDGIGNTDTPYSYSNVMDYLPLTNQTQNITSCANLTTNATYYLLNNLSGTQPGADYCLLFLRSGTTLDCQGYWLNGSGSGSGIKVLGTMDAKFGPIGSNDIIKNCNVQNYSSGIYINGNVPYVPPGPPIYANNDTVQNCTLYSNNGYGLTGNYANGTVIKDSRLNNNNVGLYVNVTNSLLTNNNVTSNTAWDFYSEAQSTDKVYNLTTSSATSSFTYSGGMSLKGVSSPPSDPTNFQNVGKYLNVTNQSANTWLNLNISYLGASLGGLNESTLAMARNNGSWETNTSTFANNYGVDITNDVVYANITGFGSIFAPLGPTGGPVTYNLTVYIDGATTTAFNYTGRPYLVQIKVTNSTGDPQQNKLVGIEEANGRNIFLPLLDQGYVYKGKAYGLTNASGFVDFVIAPTQYAIQSSFNYSISAVLLNSTLDITQQVNLTVADVSSLNKQSKSFSNQDVLKTRSENMLKIISNLKTWADAGKERRVNLTVYLNGTYDSPPQVLAGAVHRINITLINQSSGLPVQGDLIPVELNGYLLNSVDVPDNNRNNTNFAQGIKTGQIFYIVPSKYALTPYDKLIFNVSNGGSNVATINLSIYSDSLTLPSTSDSAISNSTVADNLKTHSENMLKVISNIKACVD